MSDKIDIIVKSQNHLKKFNFCDALIAQSARAELKKKGFSGVFEIEVIFAGMQRIRTLNRKYRGTDSATDVLSFPINEKVQANFDGALGSIVICPAIAKKNILHESQTLEQEIMFLIAHSIDHLVGIHH